MQRIISYTIAICAIAAASSPASATNLNTCDASLESSFRESAPRDIFTFYNFSAGNWAITSISIDLKNSAGKLIFDTEDGGGGIEVFQSYRTESGDAALAGVTEPEDGGTNMQIDFASFSAGQSHQFSIDVDDTLARSELRQIRVTGSELNGAALQVTFTNGDTPNAEPLVLSGSYDQTNKAVVKQTDC